MSPDPIHDSLAKILAALGLPEVEIALERPKESGHGDWATNVAMKVAAEVGRPPRIIAEEIASRIDLEGGEIASVEVAGPGFLNFRLTSSALAARLAAVLGADEAYGRSDSGRGRPILIEFVSANPTGPLHLGHGRQAALGDAIATLLTWTGWEVYREFYYNDRGRQMDLLARSVWVRYQQELGREESFPEDGYHGEYVTGLAHLLVRESGDRHLDDDSEESMEAIRRFAIQRLREEQDRDLRRFRVHFDRFFLESSLYEDGGLAHTIEALRATGLVYRREGATWLRTTGFGDQKDRVMIKSDGAPTYFLPDVAYHLNKWERDFPQAINVQGADHHGTVDRVHAGLRALGLPEGYPEYLLHQMVTVERGGREVKLSKRAGSYVTMRELVGEVGVDVARYFFLMRKADAHLVFDLDMALDHSEKNPLFKIQYAHARIRSIFRKALLDGGQISPEGVALSLLREPVERELIQSLGDFPSLVGRSATLRAPHLLCDYLERISGAVNSWYHSGNPSRNPGLAVLVDDPELRAARLVLARGIQIVLRNGLHLLGLESPRRMERRSEVPGSEGEGGSKGSSRAG